MAISSQSTFASASFADAQGVMRNRAKLEGAGIGEAVRQHKPGSHGYHEQGRDGGAWTSDHDTFFPSCVSLSTYRGYKSRTLRRASGSVVMHVAIRQLRAGFARAR